MTTEIEDTFEVEEAEWGEKIVLGNLFGKEQYVSRPLNQTAVNNLSRDILLAIMLHDHVQELESRLDRLEGKDG